MFGKESISIIFLTSLILPVISDISFSMEFSFTTFAVAKRTTDNTMLLLSSGNSTLSLCQYATTNSNCTYAISARNSIINAQTSADGYYVAIMSKSYIVQIFHTLNQTLKCNLQHENVVGFGKYDPTNSEIFYSGSYNKMVKKWNITTCSQLKSLTLATYITAMDISSDGSQLFVADSSMTVRNQYIITTSTLQISSNSSSHSNQIHWMYYTGVSNIVATISDEAKITLKSNGVLVASQTGIMPYRIKDCDMIPITIFSSTAFVVCADIQGYVKIFKITSSTISQYFSYKTSFTNINFVIGKFLTNKQIILSLAISNGRIQHMIVDDSSSTTSCGSYFFRNSSTNVCQFCHQLGPSSCNQCTSSTSCSVCLDGYYKSGSNCNKCTSPCTLCSNSGNCDSCYVGYQKSGNNCNIPSNPETGCLQYTTNNHKCLQCEKYSYLNTNGAGNCIICSSAFNNCIDCSSATCQICNTNYFLNGTDCSLCSTAISGCEICQNSSNCTKCTVAFQMSGSNFHCGNCFRTCLTCLTFYNQCGSCRSSDNRTLSGTNCICSYGYFQLIIDDPCPFCKDYLSNCQTCNNSTVCTLCNPHFYFITRSGKTECDACYNFCATCSINYNNCTSCDSLNYNRQLNGSNCQCKNGYIANGTDIVCYSCNNIIIGCSACSNLTYCTACNTGYALKNINASVQSCQICPYQCDGCQYNAGGNLECLACQVGSHRTLDSSNQCPCDSGYFDDNNTALCQSCSTFLTNCLTCSSRYNCLTCVSGLYPDRSSRNCYPCSSMCLTCDNFFDNCSSCDPTSNRVLSGGKCVCNSSSFSNPTNSQCQLCNSYIPNCISCQNKQKCDNCNIGFSLSPQSDQCLDCAGLINGCIECSSRTNCTACISPFSLIDSKCKCPDTMYTSNRDWGYCRNYKITGLKNQLKLQLQTHQHEHNLLIIFIRFRSKSIKIINSSLENSLSVSINGTSINKTIESQNNKLKITIPIKYQIHQQELMITFSNQTFYNQKLQTLVDLQYAAKPARKYLYSDSYIEDMLHMKEAFSWMSRIFQWITFALLMIGFIKFVYPIVIFLQIIPLFLLLNLTFPSNLSAALEGILGYQVKSVIPFGNLNGTLHVTFPPLTLDYYNIYDYIVIAKIFDIAVIVYITIMTKFDQGIMNMFPQGMIRSYLKDALIRKGYAVRSLTILSLQPSIIAVAGAYIDSRDFFNQQQLFNLACCLFAFGFYLIYNFNHASALYQAKRIRNIEIQDCYQGLNYQSQYASQALLISQVVDFWIAGAIFLLQRQVYFVITLLLMIVSFICHSRPSLYKNIPHMIVRLVSLTLYIFTIANMFLFSLGEWAFEYDFEVSEILGICTIVAILLYILLVIVEKIITKTLPTWGSFQKKVANQQNSIQSKKVAIVQLNPQIDSIKLKSKENFYQSRYTFKNFNQTKSTKKNFFDSRMTRNLIQDDEDVQQFAGKKPRISGVANIDNDETFSRANTHTNKIIGTTTNFHPKMKYAKSMHHFKGFLHFKQNNQRNKEVGEAQEIVFQNMTDFQQ